MEKKDIISKIVETIRTTFEQDGFKLKMPNKFVKRMETVYTSMRFA